MAEFTSSTKLNAWQVAIARIYADGDFKHVIDDPSAIRDIGDGLFEFLMVELDDSEDCHTKEEALTRIASAIRDLDAAMEAIELTPEVTLQ